MMGGTAAAISKTAVAPIEHVKLLIQNQGAMMNAGRLDRPYSGITDCFKRTYADEGVKSCMQFLPFFRLNVSEFLDSLEGKWDQHPSILPHASPQLRFQRLF